MNLRQKQAMETKKLLFDTAIKLLEKTEFEKITIRDIVKEAGVSVGTFYHYYETKLDVYYETYIFADEFFENTVKKELAKMSGFENKLYRFFDYYAQYNSEMTDFALTKILYNSANRQFDRKSDIGMIPVLTGVMREGIESGELHTKLSASEAAEHFMVAVRGLVYHWCTNDGKFDLKEATKNYVGMILHGIC